MRSSFVNNNSRSKRSVFPNAAKRPAVKVASALLLLALLAFVAFAVYAIFIAGTTEGPDFIVAYQTGQISPASVASVEVFSPSALPLKRSSGSLTHWDYYDDLPRQSRIVEPFQIRRLLSPLSRARAGRTHQNHPAVEFHAFLKIHIREGSYWLELERLRDEESELLQIAANTLNATNPNGASVYSLDDSAVLLTILKLAEVGEENESQPTTLPNE